MLGLAASVDVSDAASPVSPDDTARFLAGMRPSPSSAPGAASRDVGWQAHAAQMDGAWGSFEQRHMNRVRVWATANLPRPRPTMFYMFSGPDFLHAEALFPHALTYVLSGLEPVGPLPDALSVTPAELAGLRTSLNNFLQYGYFITREMGAQFKAGKLRGTLPVLYVFLARAGKKIQDVAFVTLNPQGTISASKSSRGANGVRIIFSGRDGRMRRLYYFRTDLSDGGVKKSGFLKFCAFLGVGDALVKSASYLMHTGAFTRVRAFLLSHSATLIQDDSGIPLKYFQPGLWRLHPFGQYAGPTDQFKRYFQKDLEKLFTSGKAAPVNFGIGYRWHPGRTNILVAERVR